MDGFDLGALETYLEQISQTRTGHWLAVGATCLSIYDWLVCLDLEYQYIWKARWSAGKFLYFIHRYPSIVFGIVAIYFNSAVGIPISRCRIWMPAEFLFDLTVVFFVQITLSLRVYALYEKNKVIKIFLILLLISCSSIAMTLFGFVASRLWYHPTVLPLVGCLADCHNCFSWIPMLHIPVLVYDTAVVGFTLAKCVRHFTKDRLNMPTLNIVFRDGLLYYMVTFFIILFNILWLYFSPAAMTTWFLPWMRVIISIIGTRLLLNLRGQIEEQQHDTDFFVATANVGSVPPHISDDMQLDPISPTSPIGTGTPAYAVDDNSSAMRSRMARYWNLPADDDDPPDPPIRVVKASTISPPRHVPLSPDSSAGSFYRP